MILVTSTAGLFGPFTSINLLADRAVCDGAQVPFSVVGACYVLDIEVPYGRAEDFDLVDGKLAERIAPEP